MGKANATTTQTEIEGDNNMEGEAQDATSTPKFNLSVNNIEQWNEELDSSKYIQPGDKITLYVDVTGTE